MQPTHEPVADHSADTPLDRKMSGDIGVSVRAENLSHSFTGFSQARGAGFLLGIHCQAALPANWRGCVSFRLGVERAKKKAPTKFRQQIS
jgi:hypothetical protein